MKGLKLFVATSRGEDFLSKKLDVVKTGGVYYGKKGKSFSSTLNEGSRN